MISFFSGNSYHLYSNRGRKIRRIRDLLLRPSSEWVSDEDVSIDSETSTDGLSTRL